MVLFFLTASLSQKEHPNGSSTKSCWQVANCFCKCKQAMVPTHSGARLRRVIEHKGLAQPDNPSSFPVFHDLQSKCCSQWTFPKWSWFCTVGTLAKLTCSCLTFSQVVLRAIWAQRGNDLNQNQAIFLAMFADSISILLFCSILRIPLASLYDIEHVRQFTCRQISTLLFA